MESAPDRRRIPQTDVGGAVMAKKIAVGQRLNWATHKKYLLVHNLCKPGAGIHKKCYAAQSILKWAKTLLRCMDYKNNEGRVYGQA